MSSTAFADPASAACLTGPGSPTKLITERLWSGFDSTSSRVTPGDDMIASAIELITSCLRPSLKFGTHSKSFNLLLPCPGSALGLKARETLEQPVSDFDLIWGRVDFYPMID